MPKTFCFYSDPGHAWLKVCAADLAALNLTLNDVSAYSYIGNDGAIYLEEDCDATLFVTRYKDKHGAIHLREAHTDHESHIRRMRRNQPVKATQANSTPFHTVAGSL